MTPLTTKVTRTPCKALGRSANAGIWLLSYFLISWRLVSVSSYYQPCIADLSGTSMPYRNIQGCCTPLKRRNPTRLRLPAILHALIPILVLSWLFLLVTVLFLLHFQWSSAPSFTLKGRGILACALARGKAVCGTYLYLRDAAKIPFS